MPVYMAERDLPGIEMEQLAAAQKAAIETSNQFTADGKPVRYIRTTFVPGEAHCMCLFEAGNPEVVEEVNRTANIPFHSCSRGSGFNAAVGDRDSVESRDPLRGYKSFSVNAAIFKK